MTDAGDVGDREKVLAVLREELGIAENAVEHMFDNLIMPFVSAARLGFDAAVVNRSPNAQGFEVVCTFCGAKAKLPYALPSGRSAVCPPCQRKILAP